jgi:hypothetical protein
MAHWVLLDGKVPVVLAGRLVPSKNHPANSSGDPNAACAGCHQAIYEKYRKTPMANASGVAADGFLPGSFTHEASGVSYRMTERDGRIFLKFSREVASRQPASADEAALSGDRELKYFIGSGARGRTYLFEQDSYWFEIPINWYGKKRIWDMAPNFLNAKEMPLTMPVDPPCLRCHTSDAQPSLPEARNKYAGAPFLEGGITCTACHGDASAHLASSGRTPMVKIGQLPHAQRDSICLSCHLEGQEAVVHLGRRLVDFRPGDNIFDYASFFVRQNSDGSGARATSQWEALLRSGCKRGSGDKLTCTSCHDPHGTTRSMSAAERVTYYRERCLECHDPAAARPPGGAAQPTSPQGFASSHHPENQDCTSCHMQRVRSDDIAHEQVTDHSIARLPIANARKTATSSGPFVSIGSEVGVPGPEKDRDLGLAYAFAASRGDRQAGEQALVYLARAEEQPGSAADAQLHEKLGFLHQLAGDKDAASREYAAALAADAHDSVAAGNLALLKAGDRRYAEAIDLWRQAFAEDPVQLKAGMNLAIVECGLGRKEAALGTLQRILDFAPDDGQARDLLRGIRSGARPCVARTGTR